MARRPTRREAHDGAFVGSDGMTAADALARLRWDRESARERGGERVRVGLLLSGAAGQQATCRSVYRTGVPCKFGEACRYAHVVPAFEEATDLVHHLGAMSGADGGGAISGSGERRADGVRVLREADVATAERLLAAKLISHGNVVSLRLGGRTLWSSFAAPTSSYWSRTAAATAGDVTRAGEAGPGTPPLQALRGGTGLGRLGISPSLVPLEAGAAVSLPPLLALTAADPGGEEAGDETTAASSLANLPTAALLEICSFLPNDSLTALLCTNRGLRSACWGEAGVWLPRLFRTTAFRAALVNGRCALGRPLLSSAPAAAVGASRPSPAAGMAASEPAASHAVSLALAPEVSVAGSPAATLTGAGAGIGGGLRRHSFRAGDAAGAPGKPSPGPLVDVPSTFAAGPARYGQGGATGSFAPPRTLVAFAGAPLAPAHPHQLAHLYLSLAYTGDFAAALRSARESSALAALNVTAAPLLATHSHAAAADAAAATVLPAESPVEPRRRRSSATGADAALRRGRRGSGASAASSSSADSSASSELSSSTSDEEADGSGAMQQRRRRRRPRRDSAKHQHRNPRDMHVAAAHGGGSNDVGGAGDDRGGGTATMLVSEDVANCERPSTAAGGSLMGLAVPLDAGAAVGAVTSAPTLHARRLGSTRGDDRPGSPLSPTPPLAATTSAGSLGRLRAATPTTPVAASPGKRGGGSPVTPARDAAEMRAPLAMASTSVTADVGINTALASLLQRMPRVSAEERTAALHFHRAVQGHAAGGGGGGDVPASPSLGSAIRVGSSPPSPVVLPPRGMPLPVAALSPTPLRATASALTAASRADSLPTAPALLASTSTSGATGGADDGRAPMDARSSPTVSLLAGEPGWNMRHTARLLLPTPFDHAHRWAARQTTASQPPSLHRLYVAHRRCAGELTTVLRGSLRPGPPSLAVLAAAETLADELAGVGASEDGGDGIDIGSFVTPDAGLLEAALLAALPAAEGAAVGDSELTAPLALPHPDLSSSMHVAADPARFIDVAYPPAHLAGGAVAGAPLAARDAPSSHDATGSGCSHDEEPAIVAAGLSGSGGVGTTNTAAHWLPVGVVMGQSRVATMRDSRKGWRAAKMACVRLASSVVRGGGPFPPDAGSLTTKVKALAIDRSEQRWAAVDRHGTLRVHSLVDGSRLAAGKAASLTAAAIGGAGVAVAAAAAAGGGGDADGLAEGRCCRAVCSLALHDEVIATGHPDGSVVLSLMGSGGGQAIRAGGGVRFDETQLHHDGASPAAPGGGAGGGRVRSSSAQVACHTAVSWLDHGAQLVVARSLQRSGASQRPAGGISFYGADTLGLVRTIPSSSLPDSGGGISLPNCLRPLIDVSASVVCVGYSDGLLRVWDARASRVALAVRLTADPMRTTTTRTQLDNYVTGARRHAASYHRRASEAADDGGEAGDDFAPDVVEGGDEWEARDPPALSLLRPEYGHLPGRTMPFPSTPGTASSAPVDAGSCIMTMASYGYNLLESRASPVAPLVPAGVEWLPFSSPFVRAWDLRAPSQPWHVIDLGPHALKAVRGLHTDGDVVMVAHQHVHLPPPSSNRWRRGDGGGDEDGAGENGGVGGGGVALQFHWNRRDRERAAAGAGGGGAALRAAADAAAAAAADAAADVVWGDAAAGAGGGGDAGSPVDARDHVQSQVVEPQLRGLRRDLWQSDLSLECVPEYAFGNVLGRGLPREVDDPDGHVSPSLLERLYGDVVRVPSTVWWNPITADLGSGRAATAAAARAAAAAWGDSALLGETLSGISTFHPHTLSHAGFVPLPSITCLAAAPGAVIAGTEEGPIMWMHHPVRFSVPVVPAAGAASSGAGGAGAAAAASRETRAKRGKSGRRGGRAGREREKGKGSGNRRDRRGGGGRGGGRDAGSDDEAVDDRDAGDER